MRKRGRVLLLVALIVSAIAVTHALPAAAHVTTTHGRLRVAMGWEDEPPYSGSMNAIEVLVSRVDQAPLGAAGSLAVEVSNGSEHLSLPLVPDGSPGTYRARLVPTRPGTYSLHVTGAVAGQTIDTQSTCSDRTFECVTDVAAIQFPVKDPSGSQLESKLDRELRRAANNKSDDATARWLAVAAIALAGCALVIAVGRRPQKGGPSA
jgi:hypothetical protein